MWIFLLFTLASARSLEQVYHLRHGCSEEQCLGTTTCMGKCISYLQGEACDVSTSDIELYMDMYYLKKVNVRTTCWESFVTYYIDVLGESEGMTTEEYDRKSQDSLHRVDIVDGKWYGFGDISNYVLPHFKHIKPLFLNKNDEDIFMLQPENIESMKEDWVSQWEYRNCYDQTQNRYFTVLKGGEGWSFQHWFDNLYPRIWQVYKESKSVVAVIEHPRDKILYDLWAVLGFFGDNLVEANPEGFEMKTCVYPKNSQIRAHPNMIRDLRSLYMGHQQVSNKVIWIHRSEHSTHNGGRFVTNEHEIIKAIENKGFNVITFSGTDNMADAVSIFSDAYAIVGVHGGGLYNQYFASNETRIIELMPVKLNGLLHSQTSASSIPRLAHRCIWHNANLIGQTYIRIHVKTPNIHKFKVPVKDITKALYLTIV